MFDSMGKAGKWLEECIRSNPAVTEDKKVIRDILLLPEFKAAVGEYVRGLMESSSDLSRNANVLTTDGQYRFLRKQGEVQGLVDLVEKLWEQADDVS